MRELDGVQKLEVFEGLKSDLLYILDVETLVIVCLDKIVQTLPVQFKHQTCVVAVATVVRNMGELVL